MSWRDRPYSQTDEQGGGFGGGMGGGGLLSNLPRPGAVVKWLLILNCGVYIAQLIAGDFRSGGIDLSVMFGASGRAWWQVWRYVTFQFLHGGPWHLAMNMMGVYFLGTPLEKHMGSRRFVLFYLLCGVAAGICYVAVSILLVGENWDPLIGASGGVFGIILAAAVYFPHFKIIFLFFPVPIRVAAIIIFSIMVLTILQGLGSGQVTGKFWSQVAHFGGAAMGGAWILARHKLPQRSRSGPTRAERIQKGHWEKKRREQQKMQVEVDRILEKIHTHGIASLSSREKRLLKQATDKQREEDKRIKRL